jgi:hypothetical protein
VVIVDEIRDIEYKVIQFRLTSLRLGMTIGNMEDKMIKAVEVEHIQNKSDPMLSNEKLRKIAVKERLLLDAAYTEAVAEKYAADEAVMFGEARLSGLKREFIMKYCQVKMPV